MIINTTRFGQVNLQQDDIITFPEGLLGFQDLRNFVLLDDPNDDIFAWLQSCELPSIAFPVLEPEIFGQYYSVNLTKNELELLKIKADQKPTFMNIITIPDDPTQMTANVKAPIVINPEARIARQCVLQDNNLAIREPIFVKLQSRVVQNPNVSIKALSQGLSCAVKLNSKSEIDQSL
ncbi:flagellar assembly protein FliW [Pseudobdellovibrio sp. HCB154]|uniref:flagellar assembly protein FliW n=1 Tax=Pseudobdellovibrio sp. HCB154 TaxID=3386277 RepID=UPI003917591E